MQKASNRARAILAAAQAAGDAAARPRAVASVSTPPKQPVPPARKPEKDLLSEIGSPKLVFSTGITFKVETAQTAEQIMIERFSGYGLSVSGPEIIAAAQRLISCNADKFNGGDAVPAGSVLTMSDIELRKIRRSLGEEAKAVFEGLNNRTPSTSHSAQPRWDLQDKKFIPAIYFTDPGKNDHLRRS